MRWLARVRRQHARRPWLRWMAIGMVALVVTATVAQSLGSLDDQRSAWGERHSVWVARRTMAPGHMVSPDDLVLDERPLALLPDAPLAPPAEVPPGARTWQWVAAGEVLVIHDLTATASPAARLPPGTRGVVVPSSALPAGPGDRVEVAIDGATVARATVIDTLTDRHSGRGDAAVLVAIPERHAAQVAWAVAEGRVVMMLASEPSTVNATPPS